MVPLFLWGLMRGLEHSKPFKVLLNEWFSYLISLLPCWLYVDLCFKTRERRIREKNNSSKVTAPHVAHWATEPRHHPLGLAASAGLKTTKDSEGGKAGKQKRGGEEGKRKRNGDCRAEKGHEALAEGPVLALSYRNLSLAPESEQNHRMSLLKGSSEGIESNPFSFYRRGNGGPEENVSMAG